MPFIFGAVTAFLFGAVVGSFLNVVIWRLPRLQSVVTPGSHCPKCDRPLAAWENIPLVSFLVLRARCRTCGTPISWRYFGVELLTGLIFLAIFYRFGYSAQTVAYCLFVSPLIAAFFIDLELYLIPDELNTFALLVGVGYDVYGIIARLPEHALIAGWLPRSILGAVVCAGIFVLIQLVGFALFRKEAMGDGDVKLARAIGAMLPLSLAVTSFFLAIAAGAVLGLLLIGFHSLKGRNVESDVQEEEEDESETGEFRIADALAYAALYLTFADLFLQLGRKLGIPRARVLADRWCPIVSLEEDTWEAGPTHIPFGPYMVVGAVVALFVGSEIVQWYLEWSHLAPLPPG